MKLPLHSFHIAFRTRHFFFVVGFLLLCSEKSNAQFQQYRSYDVKDGLPSSEVYAMTQDALGYLWFTTDMGVSRFDGYSFRNFTTENGLPDNTVFCVREDAKGRIWFTSFSGQICYFFNDRINTIPCNEQLEKLLKGTFITSIYVDDADTIWAGTTKNIMIKIAPGWKDEDVVQVTFPQKGGYLCLIGDRKFVFGGGEEKSDRLTVYTASLRVRYEIVLAIQISSAIDVRYSIAQMSNGNFLVTANNSITCFNNRGVISEQKLNSIGICVYQDESGDIEAGTYDGVARWRSSMFNDETEIAKFDQKIVTAIFRDSEKGVWYCTEGNGVYCVANTNFLYYTLGDGLCESKISSVAQSGHKVVTGHLDGTISVLEGKSVKRIYPENSSAFPGRPNRVASLLSMDSSKMVVATSNALYSIDMFQQSASPVANVGSKKLIKSKDGNIWSFRFRSIVKFNSANFKIEKNVPFYLYADNIFEDQSGKLWICAINGVWTFDERDSLTYLGKENPLMATRIVDIQQSADGTIWMVGRGGGLIAVKQNKFHQIKQTNGLASNMCRCVFVDFGNVVWIGTNNGLSRVEYNEAAEFDYSISSYNSQNGLLTNEVNSILRFENRLWVIHTNGISVFDPASLNGSATVPPVYITAVLVNGDTLKIPFANLEQNQNDISISFIGLSFREPGRVKYRYKMRGVNENWITTSYTSVNYQTLQPGEYTFVVEASSNQNYWSKESAIISFKILPAWWQTWTFRIAGLLVILAGLLLLFRWRISHVRIRDLKKSELQNRIASFELSALRAQMNPHFVFNAINSVQYFITTNDPDSSQKYLSKFAKLIRYVVENSKLTTIPIKQEIEALNLYLDLEALRFGTRFEYAITIDKNVDAEYTQIPSMLIQPYVENAIWHGIMHKKGSGRIEISMKLVGHILQVVVEDNGIGRSKSRELKQASPTAEHKSVGLSNTKERLEIINQVNSSNLSVSISDLFDTNGEASGTKVEIHIPVT